MCSIGQNFIHTFLKLKETLPCKVFYTFPLTQIEGNTIFFSSAIACRWWINKPKTVLVPTIVLLHGHYKHWSV